MSRTSVALVFVIGLGVAACGASKDPGSIDADVTSARATTLWGLAGLCEETIAHHAAVRQQALAAGAVRWQCGDRPGVDGAEDRGQEYCEYFAINGGKRIDRLSEMDRSEPLSCFFTSVFADVDEGLGSVGSLDEKLADELSFRENFDAVFDPALVRMKRPSNSRSAASRIISDATNAGRTGDRSYTRTAACFLAAKKGSAAELEEACEGVDLSSDSAWARAEALGAKVATGEGDAYEAQQDLAGCMAAQRSGSGGSGWRMSDARITQVAARASGECSCDYRALPDVLVGFLQGTWSSADALPPGCRRAWVDSADHPQLTICDVPDEELGAIERNPEHADDLQSFCNERFGRDIVLTAPLRLVEEPGTCDASGGAFCAAFSDGAR